MTEIFEFIKIMCVTIVVASMIAFPVFSFIKYKMIAERHYWEINRFVNKCGYGYVAYNVKSQELACIKMDAIHFKEELK